MLMQRVTVQPEECSDEERSVPPESISLFNGLNFPEVPRTAVVVQGTADRYTAAVEDQLESETTCLLSSDKPVLDSTATLPATTAVNSSLSGVTVTPTETVTTKRKSNLSSLYVSEINAPPAPTVSLYPDISNILSESNNLTNTTKNSALNDIDCIQNDVAERTSLIQREQPATSYPVNEQQASADGGVTLVASAATNNISYPSLEENPSIREAEPTQATHQALLTDLLQENTRLGQEVADLRRIVQQQQPQPQPVTTNTGSCAQATASSSSVTGVAISDTSTTAPPRTGVKYVSCGSCRQWMEAPRDAIYVVCAGCDAINNCNLTPGSGSAIPAQTEQINTESRALSQQRNASSLPWFLDCFSRGPA